MFDHLITLATDVASKHALLAYALVALSALAEALPVAGTLFPGSLLIVGISALASSGSLGTLPLIVSALLGAIVGDGVSFWLGRSYESRIAQIWPLSRYPHWLAQAESLFHRHGGKGVFWARFVQGPRAFVPVAAGMSQMSPLRFYTVNIASALIWAPSHVLVGVLMGASLQIVAQMAGRLAVLVVLLALVIWLVVWLTRRIILTRGLDALWRTLARLSRWCEPANTLPKRLVGWSLQPIHGEGLILVGAILAMLGGLWLFVGILEDLLAGDPLVQANQAIFHALQALRTHWSDTLFLALTELGDSFVIISLTVTVATWLVLRRAWRSVIYWLVAVGGAALFTPVIKVLVHWPRPTADLYSGWDAFSFPSGHATINTVLYSFLAYLIARELPVRRRGWVVGGACLIVSMIALSRLYLGAHWLADVSAGMAIGTVWVILLAISHQRHRTQTVQPKALLAVVLLTMAIVWPYHSQQQMSVDRQRYAPQPTSQQLTWENWADNGYRQLPTRRIDLGGEQEEPLVLQWAGDLASLRQVLRQQGWQVDTPWTASSAMRWLSPGGDNAPLPALPRLNDGRSPVLRATHAVVGHPQRRSVLQVWPTTFEIKADCSATRLPVWTGSVRLQQHQSLLGLLALERDLHDATLARQQLQRSLASAISNVDIQIVTDDRPGSVFLAHPAGTLPPCGDR